MRKAKLFMVFLILILIMTQFSMVSAAPSFDVADSLSGTVTKIVLTTAATGESTVWVTLVDSQGREQVVQVSLAVALEYHLVVYENDVLVPNEGILNTEITLPINPIPDDGNEIMHPVASALAVYFSEIPGVDYDFLMSAHEDGFGFGVIAQALWLTSKLEGDSAMLDQILQAKVSGDYSGFTLEDGTPITSWGQFKQAVMDGDKKGNLGVVMSSREKDQGSSGNNGNGGGQGNTGNNGNGGDNGNNGNNDNANNGNGGGQGNTGNNGNKDNKGNNNNGNKDNP